MSAGHGYLVWCKVFGVCTAGVSEDDFRDRNLDVAEPRVKADGPALPLGMPQLTLAGALTEPSRQQAVSAEAWQALPAAVDALLRTKQAVVNLDAVRCATLWQQIGSLMQTLTLTFTAVLTITQHFSSQRTAGA